MYSRYVGDNSKRSIRLPEHYGGSAFSQRSNEPNSIPKKEPVRSFSGGGMGEKVSPVADRLLRAEGTEEKKTDAPSVPSTPMDAPAFDAPADAMGEKEEKASLPSTEKRSSSSLINFDGLRRLLGGAQGEGDQDRLLLLGLILLLSRTEGDQDILLWLSLLLLCG